MTALKINDINEWLIDNRNEFQKLKAREFPPLGNTIYWTYIHLHDFIQYYKYKQHCERALSQLDTNNFFVPVGFSPTTSQIIYTICETPTL